MSKQKINERLMRLVVSGLCPREDPLKYEKELKKLADTVASIDEAERQCKVFKALADTSRLRILKLLEVREMCVCEIMIALGLTQPTASHHLGILESAGLIKGRKEGKWVFYRVAKPELKQILQKIDAGQAPKSSSMSI
ncbi:MAG: metalloregulator ArsR/SmtB family transcription factor [Candidatus Bathyarchaeia archaeon]